MRFVFISDTHGLEARLNLPEGDVLVHAGDLSGRGRPDELQRFMDWLAKQQFEHKVLIAGNHDFLAEQNPGAFRAMVPAEVHYLCDEAAVVGGVRMYGSPQSPWFYDWAFNVARGPAIRAYWNRIPADTQLLITHGPPLGYGDRTVRGESVGCADLLEVVTKVQPAAHVFGHIHEGYGWQETERTSFINASVLNVEYQLVNAPLVADWNGRRFVPL